MNDKSTRLPRQEALFDDGRESNASALVAVARKAGRLSTAQRTFNRLTERIRRGRDRLAAWEAFVPRFQGRVAAELQPIDADIRHAQRRLVRELETLLAPQADGERLSRKYRGRVRSLLVTVLDDLLSAAPDAELEALHDRYSDTSHADRRRQDVEDAEALVGGIFGRETVEGHEAQSVEELLRHAAEAFTRDEARTREASTGHARRGGGQDGAGRREQAAQEAGRSVREIYRKLASALHPDRETDAAERERKTVLMQRANQAYERDDLLELLALQIEIEQIDADALAEVPEERLRHYNRVLLEQAEVLDAQVEERAAAFRMEFELMAHDLVPRHVDQALDKRIFDARARLKQIERDIGRLGDPRQRRAVLDELAEVETEVPDFAERALLDAALDEMLAFRRPRSRRRKRRGR